MLEKNTNKLAQILLPVPFDEGFSYFVPEDMNLSVGDVVKVPFRNEEIFGVVVGFDSKSQIDAQKIKTIISFDERIKFNSKLIEFIDFVASYNMIPKGLVLKLSLAILNSSDEAKRKKIEKKNKNNITLKPLNEAQTEAANFLINKINEQKFSTILLDGVTGSGKTEVYFQAIAKILNKNWIAAPSARNDDVVNIDNKLLTSSLRGACADSDVAIQSQILILLPEIALTSQLCKRFESQFGFKPDLWHSKISPSKKHSLFLKIINGESRVLIGARSALFLPFKNLQLIVVDEEHDANFKQDEVVNYHGRDMAIVRAKIENIPIILSSATPSLESYINAKSGKYELVKLDQRFTDNQATQIKLVDLRTEKLKKDQFISETLKKLLEENLKTGRQSLLFLNRRGYAPLTLCNKCGSKVSCKNCSSYLTYHQKINRFSCHHCGYSAKMQNVCTACGEHESLVSLGVGIEKLEEEVKKYFPESRIGLMTSDHIKTNKDAEDLIEKIINHEIDIIIGTQMIAKGHHFPSLATVGIIDADSSFLSGNLRTLERSFQLLTQVIGRAGREHYQGLVVMQTYNPENLVFKNIIEDKRDEFLDYEIKNRESLNFPPFSKMATIIFSGQKEDLVIDVAKFVLKKFPFDKSIEVFGPAPMPITRVKNKYHYCLNIKVEKKINLQKLIHQILSECKIPSSIRVKVDIDPL